MPLNTPLEPLIEKSLDLPTLPAVCYQVMRMVDDPKTKPRGLATVIESDPGICASLIRVCNSAAYGFPRQITSALQAIILLGEREVRNLVVVASTRLLFQKMGPEDRLLWQHCVGAASIARMLAERYAPEARELAFLTGQLHDIGVQVLRNADRARYAAVEIAAGTSGDVDTETAEYGFSHADVGALILRRWNIPVGVELASFYHHDLALCESMAPEQLTLASCIVLADHLCHRLGIGGPCSTDDEAMPLEVADALAHLRFDAEQLAPLTDAVRERFQDEQTSY